MAHPSQHLGPGPAVFSTRNGKYAQRPALPNMSIVIRSDPREDRDSMTAKLQTEFPAICRAIRTFGTIVGDYFDGYDQELQGFEFLRAVVMHIAAINENRAGRVLGYVEAWMASNQEAFAEVTPGHTLERLFKQEDIDKYGGDFMEDAAAQIKHRKIHALRSGVAQESQRLQQQQQEPMGMELLLSRSHYGPSPSSLPASQNPRGMSKPERSQSNVQQNPAPSVPPDPSHRQRGVYSLYPLGPEHFQTGSFNPITVPPDPAHFAMSNYHSPRMSHNNTASSRGFPGSLGYGPQPRAVLSHRHQNYNDNQPKGRKNPVKRSSDDARRGSFEAGSRRQSSGRRRSSQLGTFDLVQSPQSMRSSVQSFNDPSQPPFYPYAYQIEPATDVQYQPPMTAYDLANMQNAVPYPPGNDRRQSSTSAPINPIASYARNRSATEPEHLIPQNSLPTTMTHSPDPVYLGPRLSGTGDQQTLTTRAPVASGQSPELAGQSRDSHVFEYQISNVQSSLSPTQPMAADINTHPKPSVKNENQHQAQPAQRSRHQESPKKDADPIKSVSIWIGRIPREYSKSTVLEILEPCRGLLKIGEPRVSANHYFESPDAYVFAVFQSQYDAEEALDRIPQTSFPQLPEGRFLAADWPRNSASTPNRHQQKDKGNIRRAAPQVSPTKARKANSIEASSIHEPDGGGSRNRGKLEATPSRKAAISSARDSVITSSSHAVTKEPVDKNVRPGLSQEAHVTGPMTETNMLSQTELTPSTAEPLTKERENVSASREAKDEEPASTKAPDANNDHSTTDGASESVPAATKPLANEQKAQKSSTKQHEDQTISTTQAKQANKKAKNKNRIKSHQSRAADILQKTDSPQASGGSPKSENIKPPSKAPVNPTKETFLENAALPQHGDDAAKPRATKKVSEPSVPTSSNHATNDSASQLLPDSSTLENHPGAPNMSTTTEQSPPSIADLSIVSSIPEKQFSHAQLLHGEHVPEVVPIKTDEAVSAMVETTASESIAARNSLSGDQEPESQVMTRNASSSTHREPGSASFEQSSTKQTSYLPTERSNSIVDGPRPEIVHSTSLSARQQGQNAGLDAEKLRTLLEANAASPEGPETVGDSISQPVAVHREQASATAPKAAEPTQALIEDEPLVPPALHSPEKAERCERPKQETARDSSNDTTNSNTESKTGEVATTDSPGKLSHLQAPDFHPVRSMSEEDKQLQMIPSQSCSPQPFSSPIQTRHKKKPKHFAPVKEENSSNAMVPLTEHPETNLDSANDPKSPSASQVKKAKQKKRSNKKKKKKGKTDGDLAAESSLPTPTLKNLPKPETPFLVDDGMRIPVISSPGPSNKNYDGVYATPTRYITAARAKFSQQIEGLPRSMRDLSDANSDSSNPSDVAIINTPLRSSAHGQEGLQAALVECGYQSPHDPSSDHHFTIKDPQLKRLERLQVMEEQKEEPESPGDASPDRQFIDRLQDLRRQQEFKQYCEQTAGARVLQNISAPSTPTRLPSVRKGTSEDDSSVIELEGKIEKIAAQLVSAKVRRGEKEIGTSAEDLKIQRAKVLLDLSPRRCRPGGGTTRWAMMAAEYVDDYDNMMQVSAPVTPTRKSKASSTNHSAPMPRISLPGHERSTRGSPVVSRPGSTMEHTPGWTTVRIPLKRGEDQSKVLAEYHADRNEFLGFEGRPEHRPVPKSSHQGSSESELIHTPPSTPSPQTLGRRTPSQEREQRIPSPPSPQTLGRRTPSEEREKRVPSRPSPQTLGRRTPSEEREKRIPSPPSLRHARRSAGSLGRTLEDMQAMAGSAISRASTNERAAINREGGTLFSPDMDQRRWLGNDVVGYWGQNSGANHSKVYHEAQAKTEDGKVIEELDRAEQGKVADVHAFLSSLLRLESSNSSKEDDDNQLPASGSRTEKSLIVPLRDDNDAKADADAERPSAKREAGNEDIRSQSADKSSSNMESSVDARFDRKDVVPATDRDAEVFESGPETATETEDDFNCPTPTTFGFGSESDVFIKNDDQDDSEYPVLPRGSGHSLKGGKSRSPTRGGYAAAAKKKVVAKAKNQGTKETKEKKRSDGWSVGNEETWGSGRRNSNKK